MLRKVILIYLMVITPLSVSLAKAAKKTPTGVDTKFIYLELYPKEKLKYELSWLKSCEEDQLNIKKFESFKTYPNTNKGEKVRILHFYLDPYSPCSQTPNIKGKQFLSIRGDKKMMTHIYLVFHRDISILN